MALTVAWAAFKQLYARDEVTPVIRVNCLSKNSVKSEVFKRRKDVVAARFFCYSCYVIGL
jgi:hypothetical protein